jgi:hypothetical protein
MPLKIQPPDIRDMNGKLVLLTIILSMPYFLWLCKIVASNEIDDLPSWVPLAFLLANLTFGITIVGLVRARLRKKIYQKRAVEEVKATAEGSANKNAA